MMMIDVSTDRFEVWLDPRYGIGFIRRTADGAETPLITGFDMIALRRQLNRARTNASARRRAYQPFADIADCILGEYFPVEPGEVD